MKRKIMRNLRTLEQEGMVNSKNDYQEIINAIAKVGGGPMPLAWMLELKSRF